MKPSLKFYIGVGIVIITSLLIITLLPMPELLKGIMSSPIVLGLLAILFQLLKDQAAFEKKQMLQEEKAVLGASLVSGMGEHIFKQQVTFSEEYMQETYDVINTIYKGGPRTKPEDLEVHFRTLRELRSKYALWLSNERMAKLIPFEDFIWQLSCDLYESQDEFTEKETKIKMRKNVSEKLKKIRKHTPEGESISRDEILTLLKDILGVNQLLSIRDSALQNG